MHRVSLPLLVYNHLFPSPRPTDPASFAIHLTRNLVPEVRIETAIFYGTLDTIEARYPGLDYSHPPHRMRLGRFQWHRRLFRAFDELGLTKDEIASLCRWEGTKWARERYEKDEGVIVRDTTGDDIPMWVEPPREQTTQTTPRPQTTLESDAEFDDEEVDEMEEDSQNNQMGEEDDEGESDDEVESVGFALNQRLIAAAAAGGAASGVVMDEEFERWLKEAAERGTLADPDVRVGPPPAFTGRSTTASVPGEAHPGTFAEI
ncbi:hypothetical protein FGG08_003433 [Glutinoglossum americanum]|uniref:Uncharacterized protein n=1 Tax=Glutinoglossum americanum TaxID=1670608 RepID=A0A9P8I759_9PEZI|nr:hypothetical protein FGG08_003433 [Glutinoglossum americanum]